jgi:TetR/AcrR family transcriptional regulator, cholesterol catabolism regulator
MSSAAAVAHDPEDRGEAVRDAVHVSGLTVRGGSQLYKTSLTPLRLDRLARVLDTTLELAAAGGFDGVRMREVTTRAGVALGTIYRYFNSREHLIYVATSEWLAVIANDALAATAGEPDLAERCIQQARHMQRAILEKPRLLSAWARATTSRDPEVMLDVRQGMTHDQHLWPDIEGLDQELARTLATSVRQIWYAGVVQWAFGQKDLHEVWDDQERLIRCLLRGH